MQGSVRALKPAPNLHNYDSTRNKNSDTQKYTHINKTFCSVPFTEACVLKYRCLSKRRILMQDAQEMEQWQRGGELEDCYGNWTNAHWLWQVLISSGMRHIQAVCDWSKYWACGTGWRLLLNSALFDLSTIYWIIDVDKWRNSPPWRLTAAEHRRPFASTPVWT